MGRWSSLYRPGRGSSESRSDTCQCTGTAVRRPPSPKVARVARSHQWRVAAVTAGENREICSDQHTPATSHEPRMLEPIPTDTHKGQRTLVRVLPAVCPPCAIGTQNQNRKKGSTPNGGLEPPTVRLRVARSTNCMQQFNRPLELTGFVYTIVPIPGHKPQYRGFV